LATLLESLARSGASAMYRGAWASEFVKVARTHGSVVTKRDLRRYRTAWHDPWEAAYRGLTLYACSGRTFGGLWSLLGLKALEHGQLAQLGHFSQSPEALELLTRTIRQLWEEYWLLDYRLLEDGELVKARLGSAYGAQLWKRINSNDETPAALRPRVGSHSYHVIAIDEEGNVASGTHSHESLAWGSGVFVQGVPLPASGYLPWGIRRGERRLSPFSIVFAFDDQGLRFATGSFASSILEASLQFLINLIDYRLPARQAVTLPRVGTYPHNPADFFSPVPGRAGTNAEVRNWLDVRVAADIVSALARRGLDYAPSAAIRRRARDRQPRALAHVDTGLGAVLSVASNGTIDGAVAPWPDAGESNDLFQTTGSRSRDARGSATRDDEAYLATQRRDS
jgi:gamma-glutamyltranspeptidase